MKAIKVVVSKDSAYKSIQASMNGNTEVAVCNNLDACGCTGNGNC